MKDNIPDARANIMHQFVPPSQFLKFPYAMALETNNDRFTIAKTTLNKIKCALFLAYGTLICLGISFEVHPSQHVLGLLG